MGLSIFFKGSWEDFVAFCKSHSLYRAPSLSLIHIFPRIGEIPFTSARKMMTTAHRLPQGGCRVVSKGAPDVLIARCTGVLRQGEPQPFTAAMKAKLLSDNAALAGRALRVLAVAYKDVETLSADDRQTESGLVFCGLIAMEDPPRPGVKEAVAQCKGAGILPVLIQQPQMQRRVRQTLAVMLAVDGEQPR